MNVDYVSVARKRRLVALKVLDRRQPALPGLTKAKMAPLPGTGKVVQMRERIVYQLNNS